MPTAVLAGTTAELPLTLTDFGQSITAALIIALYLFVGEPVVGVVAHRRFEAGAQRIVGARQWLYSRLLILEWGLAALVCAVVLLAPRVSFADLGVRAPDSGRSWLVTVVVTAVAVAGVLATGGLVDRLRREGDTGSRSLPGSAHVVLMLPRTTAERQLFAGLAVTAGLVEEFVYRGFLLGVISAILPDQSLAAWLALAVVAFGLAHLYQGAGGVVLTGLLGVLLAALYVVTGSLLAPVIVHACMDLRALMLGRLVHTPEVRRRPRRA